MNRNHNVINLVVNQNTRINISFEKGNRKFSIFLKDQQENSDYEIQILGHDEMKARRTQKSVIINTPKDKDLY